MTTHSPYKAHPWHGITPGSNCPETVTAFIEIVPTDTVKYEIDKASGWLKVDRPQQYSNFVPALYGFVPQTLCDVEVGNYCMQQTGRTGIIGDQDPLDICVLSSKTINAGGIILQAIPIGGLRMIDKNEADDKIIAVLKDDEMFAGWTDIDNANETIINRLKHYFLTYKDMPGNTNKRCEITHVYGKQEAYEVIKHSITDYNKRFGKP